MDAIYKWIGTFLGWIDSLTGNYLFALLVFALIMEILLLPFGIKQQKNSQRQAKLRPKEMAIRKKYAGRNDQATQQKITAEIQELYQKEHFSPLAGCLPMLIQLPVILIIYQVVINPLEHVVQMSSATIEALKKFLEAGTAVGDAAIAQLGYNPASTGGSIRFVSAVKELGLDFFAQNGLEATAYSELAENFGNLPNFTVLGINLGLTPNIAAFDWLLIVPALTFVVYFASMKLSRKFLYQPNMAADDRQAACSNKMMDFMMPIMSLFISFSVPAAVGVYWIFKSIIGTVKQFVLSKTMPLPTFTEEDIKAAEKELKGKAPAQAPREVSDKPVRSLHSIDEDDEEPYPTFVDQKSYFDKPEAERNPAKTEDKKAAKKKTKGIISEAPVKKDEKDENSSEENTENKD